jgi:hypothetical protein
METRWFLWFKEVWGFFCKGSLWSGYLACIYSSILGGLLGRTVGHMELWSTFSPFYRIYLFEVCYYN